MDTSSTSSLKPMADEDNTKIIVSDNSQSDDSSDNSQSTEVSQSDDSSDNSQSTEISQSDDSSDNSQSTEVSHSEESSDDNSQSVGVGNNAEDDGSANYPQSQDLQFRNLIGGVMAYLNHGQEPNNVPLNVINFNINVGGQNIINNLFQNVFLNAFLKHKISFNIDVDNIYTALQHIIDYTLYQKPSKEIYYEILDKNEHFGTGDGANRNVYMHLNSTMEEHNIVVRVNQYFSNLNYENYLFENEININALAKFIHTSIKYDCKLPFHLHPTLLEEIVEYNRGYPMDDDEIIYFMKTLYPDIYKSSIVVAENDFKDLDCGFNTHMEYYKSLIYGSYGSDDMETSIKKNTINGTIAMFYLDNQMFSDILSVIDLDKLISGNYVITHDIVIEKMSVEPEHYTEEWELFIKTLSYDELKNMLILITNSISLDEPIKVCICSMNSINGNDVEEDIRISTCFRKVSINENIFKNKMTENLKQYFISKDIQCIDDI